MRDISHGRNGGPGGLNVQNIGPNVFIMKEKCVNEDNSKRLTEGQITDIISRQVKGKFFDRKILKAKRIRYEGNIRKEEVGTNVLMEVQGPDGTNEEMENNVIKPQEESENRKIIEGKRKSYKELYNVGQGKRNN